MPVQIPESIRGYLYLITIFGSVVITYLASTNVIGANEVAGWTAFTAAVATMARFNLGNTPEEK